jgi:hypothetical protein
MATATGIDSALKVATHLRSIQQRSIEDLSVLAQLGPSHNEEWLIAAHSRTQLRS